MEEGHGEPAGPLVFGLPALSLHAWSLQTCCRITTLHESMHIHVCIYICIYIYTESVTLQARVFDAYSYLTICIKNI